MAQSTWDADRYDGAFGSVSAGETILDLGCGTGELADYVRLRFSAEALT